MSTEIAPVEYRVRGGPWGLIAIASVFLVVVVVGAISGSPPFIVVGVAVTVAAWFYVLVLASYEAELSADGSLEFRGVLRTQRTTVCAVRRIVVTHNEGRATTFKIMFDGGTTHIGHRGGRAFVQELLARNPSIETRGRSKDL